MARKTIAKHEAKGKSQGVSKEELSYAAFRAKLKDLGPHVIQDQHGDEMYNPLIDDLIDEVREGRVPEDSNLAHALSDHMTGREPVSETLKSYLEANPKRNATTTKNYETTVKLWIAKHKDRPIDRVTRRQALEWLEEVAEGKARDTVKRYATVMGHLWAWAHRKEEDPPKNPFEDLLKRIGSKGRAAESYDFYTPEELKQVHEGLADDKELRSMFLITLYTGFRLSECLRAERRDVHGVECFVLASGKTDNAARVVPVHPRLRNISAPIGIKASALSTRYQRLMDKLKMPKGKTFHSLRKMFGTALERTDCPEPIAARLLGHAPLGITYRIYSQGREAAQLREWVEKVRHPV
jgi:integrase